MTGAHPGVAEVADLVDLVAEAVSNCPAVAALHPGSFGQITTFLPGRRVTGVTWSPDGIVVGVVGGFPATVREIDAQIRAAIALVAPGISVTVSVEDLAFPAVRTPTDPRVPAIPPRKKERLS